MNEPERLIHTLKVERGPDWPDGNRGLTATHPAGEDYPGCDFDDYVARDWLNVVSPMLMGDWEFYRVDSETEASGHYWNGSKLEPTG